MDAGPIKRSDFNDYKTIEEVVSTLQYQVRTRPITVHMDLHVDVSMDSYPGPLGQRIVNFFTNALAHAFPADTKGNIWISCTRHGDETLRIEFKDDGCGIPDANIGRVFGLFFTTCMGEGAVVRSCASRSILQPACWADSWSWSVRKGRALRLPCCYHAWRRLWPPRSDKPPGRRA